MRTIDLFAGCGGLSRGFQNAGFQIVAAFEHWDRAAECYAMNFTHPVYRMDLSDTEAAVACIRKLRPELLIGGPPCQDFSHAGKRIEADRASLTHSFADIVRAVEPRCFVMENVDRARNSHAFHEAQEIFRSLGYGLTEMVLDASRCGVPQKRKRFFCIGMKDAPDNFLSERLRSHLSPTDMTLRDYFGSALDFEYYYRHPRNYNRRAVFSIDEPAPTMRGVNRPVPNGYHGHPNDACPVSNKIRALTTLERALIQTFPPDYHWCGSKTDMEQMIGNAVPVKLGEYVASALKDYLNEPDAYNLPMEMELHFAEDGFQQKFQSWLMEEKQLSERTARDMVSRVKRANRMYPMDHDPLLTYLRKMQRLPSYIDLEPSVRSQLKRAVNLYGSYVNTSYAADSKCTVLLK